MTVHQVSTPAEGLGSDGQSRVSVKVGAMTTEGAVRFYVTVDGDPSLDGPQDVVVSGLPEGAYLESPEHGLLLPRPDGGVVVDAAHLGDLLIVPPFRFAGTIENVTVQARAADGTVGESMVLDVEVSEPRLGPSPFTEMAMSVLEDAIGTEDELMAMGAVDEEPQSTVYKLTAEPSYGTLFRGETPIGQGDTFTQFDMDSGVLTYQTTPHVFADIDHGSRPAFDNFRFRPEGEVAVPEPDTGLGYAVVYGEAVLSIPLVNDLT